MSDQLTLRAIVDHFEQRAAREALIEPCGERPAAERAARVADDAAWLEPLFTHPDRDECLATIERLLAVSPRWEFDFHDGDWRRQLWTALVERHATSDETMAVAARLAALGGDARLAELSAVLFRWSHLPGVAPLLVVLVRDTRASMATRRNALGSLVAAHRLPPAERRAALLTLAEDEDEAPELRLRAVTTLWKGGDADERTRAATLDLLRRAPQVAMRSDIEIFAEHLPSEATARAFWTSVLGELEGARGEPKPPVPIDAPRAAGGAETTRTKQASPADLPSLLKAFEAADRWDPTDPPRRLRRLLEHPDHEAVRETLERLLIERPCESPPGRPDYDWYGPWGWRAEAWGALTTKLWRVEQAIAFVDRRAARLDAANVREGDRRTGILEMATTLARAWPGDAGMIAALERWFETPWVGDTILSAIWEASGASVATVPAIAVGLTSENARVRFEAVLLARCLAGEFPDLRREAETVARTHPDDLGTAPDCLRRWLSEAPTDEETERTLDHLAEVAATGGFGKDEIAAELLCARALRIEQTPRDLDRALAAAESRRPEVRRTGLDLLAWFHPGHPRTRPLLLDELVEGRDVAARVAAFRALLIVYGDHAEIRAALRAATASERSDEATTRMRRLFDGDAIEGFFEAADRDPALGDLRRAEAERLSDVTTRHGLSTRGGAGESRRSWWEALWGNDGGR